MIYSAAIAVAAAQFPEKRRGRAVGMQSDMFAISPGVLGVMLSAFFPSNRSVTLLVLLLTALKRFRSSSHLITFHTD